MKTRKFTQGITIFATPEMYADIKTVSDQMRVSLSELFRKIIGEYLEDCQSRQLASKDSDNSTLLRNQGNGSSN